MGDHDNRVRFFSLSYRTLSFLRSPHADIDDPLIAALPIRSSLYPSLPVGALILTFMSSEGGFFRARLTFPTEFPLLPPKMRFITPMWHPNSAFLSALRHLTITETYILHSISRWTRVYLYPRERHVQSSFRV